MKNPEKKQPQNCPATVYRDRRCTAPIKKGAEIGWMVWGRRVVAVVLLDGLYVPFNLTNHLNGRFS